LTLQSLDKSVRPPSLNCLSLMWQRYIAPALNMLRLTVRNPSRATYSEMSNKSTSLE